jgi:hypothetical protein
MAMTMRNVVLWNVMLVPLVTTEAAEKYMVCSIRV